MHDERGGDYQNLSDLVVEELGVAAGGQGGDVELVAVVIACVLRVCASGVCGGTSVCFVKGRDIESQIRYNHTILLEAK